MKKLITLISFLFFLSIGALNIGLAKDTDRTYFFYGQGCPHCAEVETYLEENNLYQNLGIEKKEIYFNRENALLFNNLLDSLGVDENNRGVPTLIEGENVIVGDKPIIAYLDSQSVSSPQPEVDTTAVEKEKTDLTILAVIGASLVDAINPCAFAVLIILMSTILATGNGRKALKTGLAFALSIFISYFLMGLGLYKALSIGSLAGIFIKIVGWLAILLGLLNLKDYFWYGKVFLMEVPLSWRPKLKSIIGSVTNPLGAFLIGFLVSLFLLPCTSGPYIVILGMLAKNALQAKAVFYLFLYNLIFITPMILISLAVYKGFDPQKAEKLRQKRLKTLHLIAGLIMLAMGVTVLMGWV